MLPDVANDFLGKGSGGLGQPKQNALLLQLHEESSEQE
jgi:hypothetical protein